MKKELLDKDLNCPRCVKMTTKNPSVNLLYLFTFSGDIKLQEVRKVEYVYDCRLRWRKYKSYRKVTYNSATRVRILVMRGFHNNSRCLHCTEQYLTSKCTNKNGLPQCISYKGEHRANDLQCLKYLERVKLIKKRCNEEKIQHQLEDQLQH